MKKEGVEVSPGAIEAYGEDHGEGSWSSPWRTIVECIHAAACRGSREGSWALREDAVCGDALQEQTSNKSCGPRRGAHATGCLWPTGDPQWKTAAWTFPAGLYAMGSTHAGEVFGTLSCRRDRWLLLLDLCDNTSQILVWSSIVILKMQTHILKIFIWCSLVFFKKIKIHLVFLSY